MSLHLLKNYIRLLFESKLPPSSNGTTTGRSGFSKNQQTSGIAGGDGRVLSKDIRVQTPDDALYYQYMQVDGPDQDPQTGETFAICKIDKKFESQFPKEMRKHTISASGPDAEQEVQTKINQHFNKIKNMIDAKIGQNKETENPYKNKKKQSSSY